jgi:hypothetical protein
MHGRHINSLQETIRNYRDYVDVLHEVRRNGLAACGSRSDTV